MVISCFGVFTELLIYLAQDFITKELYLFFFNIKCLIGMILFTCVTSCLK